MKSELAAIFKNKLNSYYQVTDDSFDLLLKSAEIFELKRNEILVDEGQISTNFYFLFCGYMIAYFNSSDGRTYNKNIFVSHDLIASTVSSIQKKPSEFTIQAVSDCTLLKMPYNKFRELIFAKDDLKMFYIHYLEKNWIIEKEKREISIVLESAYTRYKHLLDTNPDLEKNVPLLHIASHLGITPTQLSRIRKQIK